MTKQIISNSEVACFSVCTRRHYYAYGERITRKRKSDALNRGIYGHHLLLNVFLTVYKETGSWNKALAAMKDDTGRVLIEIINTGGNPKIITDLVRITEGFLGHYRSEIETWDIISIEDEKQLDMGDFTFAYTTDLIATINGRRTILDFKFVYDFYRGDLLTLLPQLPRYIGAERASGRPTSNAKYAYVRYRNLKNPGPDDLYVLQPFPLTLPQIQSSFKDVRKIAKQINVLRNLPLDKWEEETTRVADIWTCKTCAFKDLCSAELNGSDGKLLRLTEYEPNTYGYIAEED